ncbi:MAG: hypothetical protein HOB32_07190 [Nitrospina sp.]|nr:hypothetical protein [Nitrospina sp.]
MITVKKATIKDVDKLLPLLLELDNINQTQKEWKSLFKFHWDNSQNYFGYVMYDGDKAVGFLGLLFSRRVVNGQPNNFCNITSWIVKNEYRRQSLHLLLPVLELDNQTITVLTCNAGTYFITKKLGFIDLELGQRVIPPLPFLPKSKPSTNIIFDRSEIEKKLQGEALKIYYDHRNLNCSHILICGLEGICYLVGARTNKKNVPLLHIHYMSDHRVFLSHVRAVSGRLCWQAKVAGLLVDERLLQGETIFPSIHFSLPNPRVYKSDTLKSNDIDLLYSEYQILNL